MTVVDKLLDIDEDILATSEKQSNATTNILTSLDKVPRVFSSGAKKKTIFISKKNIGLSMSSIASSDFIVRAKQIETKNVEVEFGEIDHDHHKNSDVLASLRVKKDTFEKKNTGLFVYSYFFKEPGLFQSKSKSKKVNNILAVTITNRKTSFLRQPVELVFVMPDAKKKGVVNRKCSFWSLGMRIFVSRQFRNFLL